MTNLIFERTIRLLGQENFQKLQNSTILVAGIGGVGSYVAEALVRGGVGEIILIDKDKIELSNINRQLHALCSTVGQLKVEAMKTRLLDINPALRIEIYADIIENDYLMKMFSNRNISYVIDAIDDVKGKVQLILFSRENNIPLISSMGTANKLENQAFKIVDISKTKICPLARKLRQLLKNYNIYKGVKVLYSETLPKKFESKILGTISYVPATAGLLVAGEVIKDILA